MNLHSLATTLPGPCDLLTLARRVERSGRPEHVSAYLVLVDTYDLAGTNEWTACARRLAGALAGEAVAS